MRTLDLIKALSDAELKEVARTVSEHKRQSLDLLLKELNNYSRKNSEPENAQLFKKVFGKTYTKEQDYLLRNELRLLNQILYDFIVMATFRQETTTHESVYNQWLLRGFHARRIKKLFESDIDKGIKAALHENRPQEAAQMLLHKSTWLIDHESRTSENLTRHMALLEEAKDEEKRRFLYHIREIESQQAYIQLSLDMISPHRQGRMKDDRSTPGETIFDLGRLAVADWYAHYLLIKKQVFQTNGAKNIAVLKQKLEIETHPEHSRFFTLRNRLFTLGHLALEHILLRLYEETEKYHAQMLALCRDHGHPMKIEHIQNYICNQIHLRRYTNGIGIYTEYKKSITESYLSGSIAILCSFCYLFLGRADEALALIPSSAEMTSADQLLSRLIYPIAFYIRGDASLAYNECSNLRRAAKSKAGDVDQDALYTAVQLLTLFFGIQMNPQTKRYYDDMQDLNKAVQKAISKTSSTYIAEFALVWMEEQLRVIIDK